MDIAVTKRRDVAGCWDLEDLLGRALGSIVETSKGFMIVPLGTAVETMGSVGRDPCASLDAALAKIETQTRGVCRLAPEPGE